MANSAAALLFTFAVAACYLCTFAASSTAPTLTAAHSELSSYGFPVGLLPRNIVTYNLNRTSGNFVVKLGDTCRITIPPDNYLATYSKTITGKIVDNRIAELDGIGVRAFFRWWGITGIRSNGQDLTFEVGMITKSFPSKNFDESPECDGQRSSS
ncbi:OLC1v1037255C1 [Oldenlandia corymbosa var. corymbosa]|uniref:OLC1v1037255C1 n=1 Tax=Oldenlandia corymbosa var. corymbosa TaxID=529605 RepID=A0AAV1CZD4_OLDCO|nr:OLC1v1037255C1 [Oldenlandia corymbosa var. corymbosa]